MSDISVMTIPKPWGYEEVLEVNEYYAVKRLTMYQGCKCSVQFHRSKKETLVVLSGFLQVSFGPSIEELQVIQCKAGDHITIAPMTVHRMEALKDCVYLEASTPELDDVVRLRDDYGRR